MKVKKPTFSKGDWNKAPWEIKVKRLHHFIDECSKFCLYREMAREVLMNNLSPRIHALSKKAYMGSGFHYGLEQSLGKQIESLAICDHPYSINMNDYETIPERLSQWIVFEVCFEHLCEKVIEAERSSK